jgi:hypothetical protein
MPYVQVELDERVHIKTDDKEEITGDNYLNDAATIYLVTEVCALEDLHIVI